MSYRDPERKRSYQREYKRLKRTGTCQTPCQTLIPPEFRLRTAMDVLNLVAEQVQAVRADEDANTMEKARTIGFLAGIALRAVEAADLTGRVEALEQILKQRKDKVCEPTQWPELMPSSEQGNGCKP